MLIQLLVFICLSLVICIVLLLNARQRDRAIYVDLKGRFKFEQCRKEAALEFNAYFLNNTNNSKVIMIEYNKKNYILYSKGGIAVIEEKSEEFSMTERIFYGYNAPKDSEFN